MKNKLWLLITILAGLALVLAACGGPASESAAPAEQKPAAEEAAPAEPAAQNEQTAEEKTQDQEITFITQVSEEEEAAIQSLAAQFAKETGIQVKVQFMAAADMLALLQSQVEAGNVQVDVAALPNDAVEPFIRTRVIQPVTDLEDTIDPEVFKSLIEGGRVDGELWFVPYRTNVQLTYYRTDILEELGRTPPKTWDDWRAACEAFLKRDGQPRCLFKAAFDPPAVNPTQTWEWIVAAGGDPLVLNDAGSVTTYEFLQGLQEDGLLHPDSSIAKWDTSNELFARGDVYLMQNWPFGINVIRDLGLESFAVYNGVAGPKQEAHVVGGEVLALVTDTPKREAAWQFIQFMESQEAQGVLASQNNWPNVRGDALSEIPPARMEEFEAINTALKAGFLRPNISYIGDVYSTMIEAYDRIINKGEDAQTVLDELHGKMEAAQAKAKE